MNLPPGTYTFYNNFENCPHKAYHLYVAKDLPKTPPSPEMKWGNDVHKAMEHRIRDNKPLPDTMKAAEPIASQLDVIKAQFPIRVEAELAIDEQGKPTDYWGKPWLRGKIDLAVLANTDAWMLDWKTGKVREDPLELEVGALLLNAHVPDLQNVIGQYFWMREGRNGAVHPLNDHPRTWARLHELRSKMERYQTEGHWPKQRNPLCGWCPVKACEHNRSK